MIKKIRLILNTNAAFKKKKKMPNLTRFTQKKIKKCVLEDGFRDSCSENFVKFCFADKYPWVTEFTVKQVTVSRVAIFLRETLQQMAMDLYRDGWNLRNGSNVPKILHSVGKRTDYILLLVLIVLLS